MMMKEEVVVCKDHNQLQMMIKGKRTKRPRPMSPLSLAMAPSTSTTTTTTTTTTSSSGGESSDHDHHHHHFRAASPTTSTTVELTETSTEEEDQDMANCLILLAQGHQTRLTKLPSSSESPPSFATTAAAAATTTTTTSKYVHQCKTCNRCFSSFQALGGHRASHKKPKAHNHEENKGSSAFAKEVAAAADDISDQFNNMNTTLSLQILTNNKAVLFSNNSNKAKVHECSICGAEFSSGQALGGHMRRHRSFNNAPTTTTTTTAASTAPESDDDQSKKGRTVLQLDLNLPAPEDHDHHHHHREREQTKFPFASKEKLLVFSTNSLVDCHY